MKARIAIFILLFVPYTRLFSQEIIRIKKNAISINAPSFTRLYSLNYERVLQQKRWVCVSNIGVYHLPLNEGTKRLNALFVGIDFLQGKKTHFLDLGASLMFDKEPNYIDFERQKYVFGLSLIPKVGYRYQKRAKGIFFRAILMPFLIDITPRTNKEQVHKDYFNMRELSNDLVAFGLGYSF